MAYARPDALVSTEWLAAHLNSPDVRIVDGSFFLPAQKRDPKAEYAQQHIPGAVFFDIDEIADTESSLPHMLPSQEKFSSRVRKLGLGDGNKIVIYDTSPMTGACRVWWMFRAMGHKDVAVLDGGLPKWIKEGRPVTDDTTTPRERHYTARLDNTLVRSVDDVKGLIDSKREQIVDARAAGRFRGETPEPRAGLRGGHMPGAFNLPYNELLDPATGTMLPNDQLKARIAASGIDPAKKVTASCGSGVTACVVGLALYLTGSPEAAVYDGSWTEWGGREDTPIVTGPESSADHHPPPRSDGVLPITITHLEMDRPDWTQRGQRPSLPVEIKREPKPSVALYRQLYDTVGRPWLWYERRLLSDADLGAMLAKPDHELHIVRDGGKLVGYFELGDSELMFFGLTLPYIGRRIGPWLLDRAIERAFASGMKTILLNTNTLDHPGALATYCKAGFRIMRKETKDLRDPRILWPEVYRWPAA